VLLLHRWKQLLLCGGKEMTENTKMSKEELKQAKKDAKKLLKKPFYKRVWFWALVVIVIIMVANSGEDTTPVKTASDTDEEKVEASTEPKKEEKAKPKKEEKVSGIGDVVKVGDVEFTIKGSTTAKNVGGEYGSKAQGTYLILDTTVTNKGNEAITTDTSFFKLMVGEKTYEADASASIFANPDTNFFLEQVNPDLSATGVVVFDVSDEVIANPDLLLQVSTGFFGTETGTINVAK
jgi:hypothetical protein